MRTTIGLIIGLALGMLLMHFSTSAFRLKKLSDDTAAAPTRPPLPATPPGMALETAAPALSRVLLREWQSLPGPGAIVGVVSASDEAPFVRAVIATVIRELTTAEDVAPRESADPAGWFADIASVRALFCADHSLLAELLEEQPEAAGFLPPIYTIGWSPRLQAICRTRPDAVGGIAVLMPIDHLRRLNQMHQAMSSAPSAPRLVEAVILTPGDLPRLMDSAESGLKTTAHQSHERSDHE